MHQTCLCKFLSIDCNHADTLLHIPASLRERIYLHAGLPTGRTLDFDEWPEDAPDALVLSHICPLITHEVEGLMLQHNTMIYPADRIDETLNALWRTKADLCARLRNVYLHLNEDAYYGGSSLRWDIVKKWQGAAMHVLRNSTPGQLRFHLICDVGDDVAMARAVARPFEYFPGHLRELELSLSAGRKPEMTNLAQETVTLAETPHDADGARHVPFPFFKLPLEIRRHILTYTGLVVPHRSLLWTPGSGFSRQYIDCECDESVCRETDIHDNRHFARCDASRYGRGYFCKGLRSAYSRGCRHDRPLSLLLANRALYQEARAVFLASNRITIAAAWHPEHAISMWDPSHNVPPLAPVNEQGERDEGGEVSGEVVERSMRWDPDAEETYSARQITRDPTRQFIERVGTDALQHLREVEIVLPRFTTKSSLEDTAQVYVEWCDAVDIFSKHVNAGALTLMVHVFTTRQYLQWPLEQTASIRQTQGLRLITPLQGLENVRRLFVFLEWPQHWTSKRPRRDIEESGLPEKESPGCGIGLHHIPRADPLLVREEKSLERCVMGDDYDSLKLGKYDVLPSPWLRSSWDYPQE